MTEILPLPLNVISINGGTQARTEINQAIVLEYAKAIIQGAEFPPVVVFEDGVNTWLADGFHRYHAHNRAKSLEIICDVRSGTQRDAILYSLSANSNHGLRRTNEDKRKAVMTLLNDAEWSKWSDNAIAKACTVSHTFVQNLRPYLATLQDTNSTVRKVERNGKTYEQNTANIGKAKQQPIVNEPEPQAQEKSEVEELREHIELLSAELKDTVKDNEVMGKVFDADDKLAAAMKEIEHWRAIAESAERTLLSKNSEYVARAKQVEFWKNKCQKLEKRLSKYEKVAA